MGNDMKTIKVGSNQFFDPKRNLKEQIMFLGSVQDEHLGLLEQYCLRGSTTKQIAVIAKIQQKEIQSHYERKNLQHPHLLEYMGCTQDEKGNKYWFEGIKYNLKNIIKDKRSKNLRFTEDEIWHILKDLSSVCDFLDKSSYPHSYIQSEQIYFNNQEYLKVVERGQLRNTSGYEAAISEGQKALLSPQQLEQLKNRVQQVKLTSSADVYSAGMVMLELMSLKDSTDLYRYQMGTVIGVEQRLIEAEQYGYSKDLIYITKAMLEYDEGKRITFQQILESEQLDRHMHVKWRYQQQPQQQQQQQIVIQPKYEQKVETPPPQSTSKTVYVRQIQLSPNYLNQVGVIPINVNGSYQQSVSVKQVQLTTEQLQSYAKSQNWGTDVIVNEPDYLDNYDQSGNMTNINNSQLQQSVYFQQIPQQGQQYIQIQNQQQQQQQQQQYQQQQQQQQQYQQQQQQIQQWQPLLQQASVVSVQPQQIPQVQHIPQTQQLQASQNVPQPFPTFQQAQVPQPQIIAVTNAPYQQTPQPQQIIQPQPQQPYYPQTFERQQQPSVMHQIISEDRDRESLHERVNRALASSRLAMERFGQRQQ